MTALELGTFDRFRTSIIFKVKSNVLVNDYIYF